MKFKYNLSQKDYKKLIKLIYEYNARTNLIWLIISSILFLFILRNVLLDNILVVLISYLIGITVIGILLIVTNKIFTYIIFKISVKKANVQFGTYECQVTEDQFIETINETERIIEFKDLKKMKKYKKMFIIFTHSVSLALIFKKELFEKPEDYDNLLDIFDKKIKKD